ncbi:MAG: tetratricopeptide repeat protein [Bacteroidota bacterium]
MNSIRLIGSLLMGLSLGSSLWGQNISEKDSLLRIWLDQTQSDQQRLKALADIGRNYLSERQSDSAVYYGQMLKEAALERQNLFYQAVGLSNAGNALRRSRRYDEALPYLKEAYPIWETLDSLARLAYCYYAIGQCNRYLGQNEEGLEWLHKSIDLKLQLKDSLSLASPYTTIAAIYESEGEILNSLHYNQLALEASQWEKYPQKEGIARNNLANNYKFLGEVEKAAEQYFASRAIYEQIGDTAGMINSLSNLSVVLIENGDFKKAETYLEEGEKLAQIAKDPHGQAMVLANKGYLFTAQEKLDEGLAAYLAAHQLIEKHNLFFMKSYIISELGITLSEMNRLDEAEQYLMEGLSFIQKNGSPKDVAYFNLSLAQLNQKKGNLSLALQYAKRSFTLASSSQSPSMRSDAANALAEIHKAMGNSSAAFEMLSVHMHLKDSLASDENTRSLLNQSYRYDYQQKTYQDSVNTAVLFAKQEEESSRRRTISYFLMGGLALTLIFGLVLANRFRITQRQKQIIEEEKTKLDEANAKLKELDDFKSRFFTNISHEFRTPLTVVGGMLQQIRKDPQKWLAEGISLAEKNVNRLLSLINQILDLRKLEAGSLSLNLVQDDAVAFLKKQTEALRSLAEDKEIHLEFEADQPQILMDFDIEKLLIIHTNLLSNALKFTEPGGVVAVSLERTLDAQLSWKVADTGRGISTEKLPYIFDRFYQVDTPNAEIGEGTGIGLSLSHELVQFMGGSIAVSSRLGEGTSFEVLLPIEQKAALPAKGAASIAPMIPAEVILPNTQMVPNPSSTDLPSLLIIEDNPDLQHYLYALLEDSYNLMLAKDGAEGIEMALEYVPDLIISDVMMPKKNGYEVCDILKADERTSHIPIVLLTAKADQDSKLQGLKKGADAYLTKPFHEEELLVRLDQLLSLRQRLQARYAGSGAIPPPVEPAFELEDAFILKVRQAILDRLDDSSYRPEDLIKDIGVSRTQMYNKLKALTGKSVSHFVRSVRLEKAKELLLNPEMHVGEVAHLVGFEDPMYFTRVFKKETELSPSSWREQHLVR